MRNIFRILCLSLIALGLLSFMLPDATRAEGGKVVVLQFDGTVNPVTAGYIGRGIGMAEEAGAEVCVIVMNTLGGLDSAMRDIVRDILGAEVPVAVYVPPGGRAASAGAFIMLSAHIAAMGQGTEIGAASPVALGGGDIDETMQNKIVNDAVAYIRSIAEARGRNASWAEEAVRDARSSPSSEALALGVIDITADSLDDLLLQIDGWEVTLISGRTVVIATKSVPVENVGMTALERFLYALADPNIAYILMSLGILGIVAEIFNPGMFVPGITGGICLLLSFFALGVLPINYIGLALIGIGLVLFIAEVFITSHGLLALGGLASFVLGSIMLISDPMFHINRGLIAGVSIAIAAFFVLVVASIVRTHRRKQQTGAEAMIGMTAFARTPLDPDGTVFVHGELWQATVNEGTVQPGEEVVVTEIKGLHLTVSKKKEGGE